MTRRQFTICSFAFAVLVCAGLIAFVALPSLRHAVAERIVGRATVHGTMHINTPVEAVHNWLAPPILRDYANFK
jgi:hypothetical protein